MAATITLANICAMHPLDDAEENKDDPDEAPTIKSSNCWPKKNLEAREHFCRFIEQLGNQLSCVPREENMAVPDADDILVFDEVIYIHATFEDEMVARTPHMVNNVPTPACDADLTWEV
jgi:hypothetical protein